MIDLKKAAHKICLKCGRPVREHEVWLGFSRIVCPNKQHMDLFEMKVRSPTTSECFTALNKELKNLWGIMLKHLFKN